MTIIKYQTKKGNNIRINVKTTKVNKVAKLATKVNALERLAKEGEVKYHQITNSLASPFLIAGQLNANTSGAQIVDVSLVAGQGVGIHQRVGNKVNLIKSQLRCSIGGQGQTTGKVKYRIEFWRNKGIPVVSAGVLADIYLPNPWIKAVDNVIVYDTNCERNPDTSMNYSLIKTLRGKLQAENFQYNTMQMGNTHNVYIKMNRQIHFNTANSTGNDGQVFMIVLCDNGNMGTVANLQGVVAPSLIASTGILMSFAFKNYFTDD